MLHHINSSTQGLEGTGVAVALFSSRGNLVSQPFVDIAPYDLLVDVEGDIKKVQVKTSRNLTKAGTYRVTIATTSNKTTKPFDRTKVDYLFVLTAMGDVYLIPSEAVTGTYSITLGKKYTPYLVGQYKLAHNDTGNSTMDAAHIKMAKLFDE